MSASREKNKRKEEAAAPAAANEAKKGMSKGLKTTLIAVCAVLIVCIVVFFYMLTSGFFASHTTAATVGTHKLTPAMVNYFYKGAYGNMQNQYGDFMSYIIDSDTPLDEQVYDEESGETWADYFTDQGLINATPSMTQQRLTATRSPKMSRLPSTRRSPPWRCMPPTTARTPAATLQVSTARAATRRTSASISRS